MLRPGQHIHIVGVGGFGMSAIARVLLQQGFTISGSDLKANDFTRDLAAAGASIFIGHAAENIAGADVVVISSAVPETNPEVGAARAAGIPVRRRREMLGELMAQKVGIAVAGTHGKTTTTALIAHILNEAGLDPTYIIGGVLRNTGTNAGVGRGDHFVIEADEYDRMFLGLRPQIAVITNIEHDHPDCYPTLDDVIQAFEQFVALLPDDGLLVVCADSPHARRLGEQRRAAGKPVAFYGVTRAYDGWYAADGAPDPAGGMRFTLHQGDHALSPMQVNLEGAHNVQNALAAIIVARHLDVRLGIILRALQSFQGTGRRSEIMGQVGGVTVVSDYAHHPTEIRVTLAAWHQRPGVHELWAVWQPHTFGRMRALAENFPPVFSEAQHVLVTDVYSVRETVSPGLDAARMTEMIRSHQTPSWPARDVRYTASFDATVQALIEGVQPGDVVVILSAGDAPQIGERLLEHLRGNS
jgi:UDP-N-acetylmuramate--alanine ligase